MTPPNKTTKTAKDQTAPIINGGVDYWQDGKGGFTTDPKGKNQVDRWATKTDTTIEELLDTLIAEVRMWALNHEGNIARINPIYIEAKQAIGALVRQQRQELLDQVEREVIGDNAPEKIHNEWKDRWGNTVKGHHHDLIAQIQNLLRAEQRQKLSTLKDKLATIPPSTESLANAKTPLDHELPVQEKE